MGLAQGKNSVDIVENTDRCTYIHTSAEDAETLDSGMNVTSDLEQVSFRFQPLELPLYSEGAGPADPGGTLLLSAILADTRFHASPSSPPTPAPPMSSPPPAPKTSVVCAASSWPLRLEDMISTYFFT